MNAPIQARFEAKIADMSDPAECWLWCAARHRHPRNDTETYGTFLVDGRSRLAHRVAMAIYKGFDLSDKRKVCHKCDTPNCVNPAHLFIGTQLDNVRDMHAKGRARKNPLRGEAAPTAKLTADLVRDIRSSTESNKAWARRLGVGHSVVSEARRRITWAHIT